MKPDIPCSAFPCVNHPDRQGRLIRKEESLCWECVYADRPGRFKLLFGMTPEEFYKEKNDVRA